MNHMAEVCSMLGLQLFEKFDIEKKHPHVLVSETGQVRNPYYFTDEGMVNRYGILDNAFLPSLIVGTFVARSCKDQPYLPRPGKEDAP